MSEFKLVDHQIASFIIEKEAFLGVRKIAEKVTQDIELVCQKRPQVKEEIGAGETIVLVGTWGKSPLLQQLAEKQLIKASDLEEKREVFMLQLLENPLPSVKNMLVIAGSDKRGTIYGLFELSELIGVTPYIYWGDVIPKTYQKIILNPSLKNQDVKRLEDETTLVITEGINKVSKEPSVKYRGFFINDEWPCFGNWTFSHFGGFNAKMYDKVFEFLLRLKGNYLWPAMWTSSFALDGPGLENAELADLYGIVIGNSHHEPCLRSSEEWDFYKQDGTPYGTEWNYVTNKEGLLRYWEDGLKRSGGYESLITIGMRGERDSSMLGEEASLKENIDLLKEIITAQRQLIKKYVHPELSKVPQLLALYKEVEAYFYGDDKIPGLKEWEELEGVTFMLCEDNFGNMRTLPPKALRERVGGWGMYYHLDYHGAPISYEWINSTPLNKIWEQMSMAYDYGVHEVWIVNVGDLKFNEIPLGYFMSLAYDFEKWGTNHPNQTESYMKEWMSKQFKTLTNEQLMDELCWVQKEYVRLNSLRRPEALNSKIYHPAHFNEAERMIRQVNRLEERAEKLLDNLPKTCQSSYYSMIYFPAIASANLLKMHLCAGMNGLYAEQGRPLANKWAKEVKVCIQKDKALKRTFSKALGGKWQGMEQAHHIGFTNWNDQDYRYPVTCYVEPADEPRLVVVKKGETKTYTSSYFTSILEVNDFLSAGCEEVILELINGGVGGYDWHIENNCKWLSFSKYQGTVQEEDTLSVRVLWEEMIESRSQALFYIIAGHEKVIVQINAQKISLESIPLGTFLPRDQIIVMEAEHYIKNVRGKEGQYQRLEGYGRTLSGMKAFPTTTIFSMETAPYLVYQVWGESTGEYILEAHTAPSNPIHSDGALRFGVSINEEEMKMIPTTSSNYRGGDPSDKEWSQGVLDNIHKTKVPIQLQEGINFIKIYAIDAPVVLERFLIYPKSYQVKASYLGPKESYSVE